MKKSLYITLLIFCLGTSAFADAVFECQPTLKITADEKEYKKEILNPLETARYKTVITAKDNKYYWSSNNNNKLYKNRENGYSTYVSPKGKGYIKIKENLDMPYMEHRNKGFQTETFYGSCK